MSKIQLSVTIITFNEEKNIERCLQSVKEIADEIVVVDSFSTDNTKKICQDFGVNFIQNQFDGHIQQKNFAVGQAKNDYVLSLDADEALTEELLQSIATIKENAEQDAYSLNRLTSYCGQWIHHCGWYPDRKIRLWNKNKGKWSGENPHDMVIMQNDVNVQQLKGDLQHYSFPTIASHVETANNFSEIAAKEAVAKGKKIYFVVHILLNPIFTFFSKYILKRGFMDGYYGFVICVLSGYANFLKYTKIWQLKKDDK